MKHIRRSLTLLIASITTLVVGASAAAAVQLPPPPPAGPDSPAGTAVSHSSGGLAIWQLALIAAASAIVLVLATMFATLSASRARRPVTTSA